MKKNKIILVSAFCLALCSLFLSGCLGAQAQKKNAPQEKPIAPVVSAVVEQPKKETSPEPAVAPAATPAPESELEVVVVPAPVDKPVLKEPITFRCAFWTAPKDETLKLFVKEGGKFRICNALEMVFPQTFKASAGEPIVIYKESKEHSLGYAPYATINPMGMENFGAIILPDYDPKSPKKELIQVFNCDEKVFPYGAMRILNWSGVELFGELISAGNAGEKKVRSFKLKYGEAFVTRSLSKNNQLFRIKLYSKTEDGREVVAYSSATGISREDRRTTIFIIPEDHRAKKDELKFAFRTAQERRKSTK